jgi:gamma-glutamyltranspeptidase / glutathione hydrolase
LGLILKPIIGETAVVYSQVIQRVVFLASVLCVLGCVTVADGPLVKLYHPVNQSRVAADYQATSKLGMVVAAHPLASTAGAAMLEAGGNAIDAAVAASFVISVVRPQSTGLGGGGFMLYHDGVAKRQRVFDFRERAPQKSSAKMFVDEHGEYRKIEYNGLVVKDPSVNGHLSVAIPGTVKGLVEIQRELGKLDLRVVMEPAIAAAEKGFVVYGGLADAIVERQEWLRMYPASRQLFFKGTQPLVVGDLLIQSDLAKTLREIAKSGTKDFYEGELAKKIIAEMKRGGGALDLSDMRSYRVIERAAVTGHYRGHKIVSMPPPSSGGTHIIEMLNMLETHDVSSLHPRGATYLHLLTEVMRRAFADRAKEMGDSDFVSVPLARLLSKSYGKTMMKSFDPEKATDSKTLADSVSTGESPSTSHLSVVDQWGNAVASTQTVNYSFGSCVVAEGTGIVLNDEMDDFTTKPGGSNVFGLVQGVKNEIAPRKTPLSSMSPTMVFSDKGSLELVLGSPGGPRIINAVLQSIVNVVDFKMTLLDAVHASRIHHQWMPDVIRVEADSLDSDAIKKLEELGHKTSPIKSIGDVQAIQILSEGTMNGVSDSRSDGQPVGPRERSPEVQMPGTMPPAKKG